jgi:hypothetical protein
VKKSVSPERFFLRRISFAFCQITTRDRCYEFLNNFLEKISESMVVFDQTTASFCKNVIITLGFEKNANFLAENWQKSQKIVIITSTPE